MPVIATDKARLSALIKDYDEPRNPALFVDVITANETAATTYTLGTVLGQITASGKWIVSKPAATDGSQTPKAIYIGTGDALGAPSDTVLAANTDTKVLALTRGKVIVAAAALVLDPTINDATKRATAYAALKAVGILVETSV